MAALLGNDDLFVVQLQDTLNAAQKDQIVSVKFETVRDSAVHIAVAGTPNDTQNPYADGDAGIMYPGRGFYYDENTGQLDVSIDSDLKFIGLLTPDDSKPGADANDGYFRPEQIWDNGVGADGLPNTRRGNFFVVGGEKIYLSTQSWHMAPNATTQPTLGDLVVCVNDSVAGASGNRDTHEWNVIPNVTGGQAVLDVRTSTPDPTLSVMPGVNTYTEVVANDPLGSQQRPLIRIRKAGFIQDASDTQDGGYYVGGLIDNYDKEKIDKFDLNLFQDGWVKSLTLHEDTVTNGSLDLIGLANPLQPQYPHLTLSVNEATETSHGTSRIAKQVHVQEAVFRGSDQAADTVPATGLTDEVVMTPDKTVQNFVPRMFRSLPNLETSTHGP